MKHYIGVLSLFVVLWSFASNAMILPKNNLHLQDSMQMKRVDDPKSEENFNQITDYVIGLWAPYAKLHGAELKVEKRWKDSTVNAYAQQIGNTWQVTMFGGLYRRNEVTPDAYALVICHELGHHFSGYPFYNGRWAGSEGQSDYYATQICGRQIFSKGIKAINGNAKFRFMNPRTGLAISPVVKEKCDAAWSNEPARDRCYRLAYGGLSLATLLNQLGDARKPVKFETPDKSEVSRTYEAHPQAQCRLDTYFEASLCPKNYDAKVIPGKVGASGMNTADSERASAQYTCMQTQAKLGYRPACWFRELAKGFSMNRF